MCLAISAELVGLDRDALQELARRLNTDGWEFDVSKPARWFRAPLLLYFNGGPCACECLSADGLPRRILRGSGRHRVGTGAAGSLDPANERQPRCEVRAHRQTRTASASCARSWWAPSSSSAKRGRRLREQTTI